jgi:hypothetical protein
MDKGRNSSELIYLLRRVLNILQWILNRHSREVVKKFQANYSKILKFPHIVIHDNCILQRRTLPTSLLLTLLKECLYIQLNLFHFHISDRQNTASLLELGLQDI